MDHATRPAPASRDKSRQAAAHVFEVLREEIISLALPPGTPLLRPALQERFGLSSTPIRDALLRLQEEGLVEIFPQHTTIVSLIDVESARQAQFLRRALETEIARVLSEAADAALVSELRSVIDQQEWAAKRNDLVRFWDLDLAFHAAMYRAAGIPDLWATVRRHNGQIDRLRHLHLPVEGKARQVIDDHAAIASAIEKGNATRAQECVREHLSKSIAFSPVMRQRHPRYFR